MLSERDTTLLCFFFALKTNKQTSGPLNRKRKHKQKHKKNFNSAAGGNGLLNLISKCACTNSIYFVPVGTGTYGMIENRTLLMALKLVVMSVSVRTHPQLPKALHSTKTHLKVPNRGNN